MILFFIFILVSVTPLSLHADETLLPSFRSSVVTNDGKPILRGGGPEPEEEEEQFVSGESEVNGEDTTPRNDSPRTIVDDLSVLIDFLINNYGYKIEKQSRRADGDDVGTSAEEFRSSRKKRKSKKNKQDKRKGSIRGKNKHTKHKKYDVKSTENSNIENDVNLSNENLSNNNNNDAIGETLIQPSNNKKIKVDPELNRENDDKNNYVNNFSGNVKASNNNVGGETIETSINLMDIVDMIRNKLSSFEPKVEKTPTEILRMPTDDIDKPHKNNFSLAFSFQI